MNGRDASSYQSLPPLERARYFRDLLVQEGISASELARRLNKSLSYVSNTLRLLKLPALIQDALTTGAISEGHARAMISVRDEQLILGLYKQVLVHQISVRTMEVLVRDMLISEREAEPVNTQET